MKNRDRWFAWTVFLGLAQTQLTLDHEEANWNKPSLKAWGGPVSGEVGLLGSQQEKRYLGWVGILGNMKPIGDGHQLHHLVLLQGNTLS